MGATLKSRKEQAHITTGRLWFFFQDRVSFVYFPPHSLPLSRPAQTHPATTLPEVALFSRPPRPNRVRFRSRGLGNTKPTIHLSVIVRGSRILTNSTIFNKLPSILLLQLLGTSRQLVVSGPARAPEPQRLNHNPCHCPLEPKVRDGSCLIIN